MCFGSKRMTPNVFLHNGGKHNAPILSQRISTAKDLETDQCLIKLAHIKFDYIPVISKQDNDQFHTCYSCEIYEYMKI